MAHRELDDQERAVLAHVELNPDGWWNNVCLKFTRAQAESRLTDKLAQCRGDYESASAKPGYRTRAQRTPD